LGFGSFRLPDGTYQGVRRSRRLTKSEGAKYRKIREQVTQEVTPAKPSPAKVAIA